MATETTDIKMIDHHVSNIPKKVKRDELEKVFDQYGAKVTYYKWSVSKPFAFVDIPEGKVDEVLAATIKLGELNLEIKQSYKSVKFFMDTRNTEGDLDKIGAEQLETYFGKYGEVVSARKIEGKGFGFLIMKEDDGYTKIDCESNHVIDDQIVSLSLSSYGNPSISYFLDSRETEGDLDKISNEQLTNYFSRFGEVIEARTMDGKGFGFLSMKKEEDNTAVQQLAFNLHTIEGQEINVSEQKNKRRRARNGKRRNFGKKGSNKRRRNRKNNNNKNQNNNKGKQKVIVENQTLEALIKSE